jgi:8-oxo-dGTP pyrophosphatase MutT (NUDIX family)
MVLVVIYVDLSWSFMSEPLTPRPAATVMVVRDAAGGFEVLMLQRNLNSDFVGGAYVFPGGGIDAADASTDAEAHVTGHDDASASARLGLPSGGLAYYVACVRELFEEAGVLLALDASGAPVSLADEQTRQRYAAHRRAVNAHEVPFLDVVRAESLVLDLRSLEYAAHWVTPVGPPRRYDTRFFVAKCPRDQIAAHDQGETIADEWVRPSDALERQRRGELEMIFPTIKNLESIAALTDVESVLAAARARVAIPRIEPRLVQRDGGIVVVVPGDHEYDE